jgi:hypothetical protein
VSREGIDAVLTFEKQAGRIPTEMPHFNEGYDIESRDDTGEIERYIEVKSIGAVWGECGVTLSQPQFKMAQKLQNRFWLYVVENAGLPGTVIYRIQNPALQFERFVYDCSWRMLAESSVAPATPNES